MECGLVSDLFSDNGGRAESSTPFAYTKVFEDAFPHYLAMGMSYEQFFESDCCLVKYYRQAEKIKLERKNEEYWLQGMYTYQAIYRLVPILRSMSKATKPEDYLEEPIPVTKEQLKAYQDKQREKDLAMIQQRLMMLTQGAKEKQKLNQTVGEK